MRVLPIENDGGNECWISDRDRFAYEGLNSEERLVRPMVKRAGEIAYREVNGEAGGDRESLPVLLLHGYPQTSFMWRHLMDALAASGRRAIAPDLPGYGDSPLTNDGTWESHVGAIEAFRQDLGLERVALVVHDWGGLIGMRWACDHPQAAGALALSGTGFFPDGKWHGLGEALRTEGAGEAVVDAIDREYDNLRTVLGWARESGDYETLVRLAGALVTFWYDRGHLSEGQRWLSEALETPPNDATMRPWAWVQMTSGMLAQVCGETDRAAALVTESFSWWEQSGARARPEACGQRS